jgi:CRISPR/Cas system-associated exonuclease Cas4 (RecB family)
MIPQPFQFSQSALQDYGDCPRRFELRYVAQFDWPALDVGPGLELEARVREGQLFHELVHQHTLGVAPELLESTLLAPGDGALRGWWERYLRWQAARLPRERQAELTLSAPFGANRLMAKYDLVAREEDGSFLIVDWKTGRPSRPAVLKRRWQSVVYPYVLTQAGGWLHGGEPIDPERITMIYWFAGEGEQGKTIEFPYSVAQQREDEARLREVIAEMLSRTAFPLTTDERTCRFCRYRSFCDRGREAATWEEDSVEGFGDPADVEDGGGLRLDDLGEVAF